MKTKNPEKEALIKTIRHLIKKNLNGHKIKRKQNRITITYLAHIYIHHQSMTLTIQIHKHHKTKNQQRQTTIDLQNPNSLQQLEKLINQITTMN